MNIPKRLKDKLLEGSFVYPLYDTVENCMSKHMPFFPEYTRHDMTHITAVLDLVSNLIPDSTLEELKPETIEILIAAVLIHDLGMFIQRDGLERLIFGDFKDKYIEPLDMFNQKPLTWGEAWNNYYKEVRRYSQQRIDYEFGNDINNKPIDILNLKPDEIDMNYAKVYGGFLRRYHPRLAHDIAMNGFAGTTPLNVLPDKTEDYQRKLIGLAARSHGMNLRDTETFLNQEFHTNPKKPHKIPIYYIMAVLRMADYLHAGKKRAPKETQDMQAVITPSSLHEISWNQAVYDDMHFDEDSKRQIYIYVQPENSTVFLALEKWLTDVQRELDLCWAVLDEKYRGTYELSIHRIISDIFDETSKNNWRKSFLPRKAQLTANSNIIKHMIAPLYGDNPKYGVRELLQNAIDACNELREKEEKPYKGEITVKVDTKKKTFTITDNGVGMDENVLINYYLNVGASYRNSESWSEKYADDNGKSRVVRSGRFGVGVMASFLLGEHVTVTTRHYEDTQGYRFEFGKDSGILNVVRTGVGESKIGTEISIDLTDKVCEDFQHNTKLNNINLQNYEWADWYHMTEPSVTYFLNGNEIMKNRTFIDTDDINWFDFDTDVFDSVKWSFEFDSTSFEFISITSGYNLFCNGIAIESGIFYYDTHYYLGDLVDMYYYGFITDEMPCISICDKNGMLDLSLNRKSVKSFPEIPKLMRNLYAHELIEILSENSKFITLNSYNRPRVSKFVFSDYGFTLNKYSFLLHAEFKSLFIVFHNVSDFDYSGKFRNIEVINFNVFSQKFDSFKGYSGEQSLFEKQPSQPYGHANMFNIWHKEPIITTERVDIFDSLMEDTDSEHYKLDNGVWHFTPTGGGSKLPVPNGYEINYDMPLIVEYAPAPTEKMPEERNIMLQVLREYMPHEGKDSDGWIPMKLEERVKRYPKAFIELFKYIPKDRQPHIRELLAKIGLKLIEP